jgi:hypothetical protein
MNHCPPSPYLTIGGLFSLSPGERAGVRENLSDENVVRFMERCFQEQIRK